MEPFEWEPEDFGEDFPTEWEPEFVPGLSGVPSPSEAVARRFFPSRRPSPASRPVRPVGGVPTGATPMTAAIDRIRVLDERQRATTTQLAMFQQRTAIRQSSQTFGPVLTGAAGALALGLAGPRHDWFSPAVIAGLPLMQLLVISRGRAMTSGFRSNPWSTIAFPTAAVLLAIFRDKIPGAGAVAPSSPDLTFFPGAGGRVSVFVQAQRGVVFRFTQASGAAPADPDAASPILAGPVALAEGDVIKVRAFSGADPGPITMYTA